jgi:multidrug resistance efflux pump
LALLTALAIATWITIGRADAPATASTAPAPDTSGKTTLVRRGDLDLALDFQGVFEPVNPLVVRIRTKQYHDDFIVKHAIAAGTKVARGEVLLELESAKIDLAVAAAQNALNIAQANRAKAQADVSLGQQSDALAMSSAKNDLVNAQTSLKRWDDIDAGMQLLAAKLQSRISDFYVENDTDELDQLRKMYNSEELTNETADIVLKRAVRTLDLDTTTNKIAHSITDRYAQFEQGILREQLASRLGQETIGVSQLSAAQIQGKELRDAALVTARAAEAEASKNLDELRGDQGSFTITSGIDGIVVYGNFSQRAWHPIEPEQLAAGEKVQPDQILMTVYRPGDLQLSLQCPEGQTGYFSPGTKVRIVPLAMQDLNYDGICEAMSVIGEAQGPQQAFNLIVDLPSVDGRLAPGFAADVNLDAGTIHDVLLIPLTAVWRDKVWVSKPGPNGTTTEEARIVTLGKSDGENVEIKSGLAEGDEVLTQAKHPG